MNIENIFRTFYTQSKIVRYDGNKYVKKCYGSNVSLKWFFITPLFRSYPYVADPNERMRREIDFLTNPWKGISVPRLIDFDFSENCIVREFIEGKIPATIQDFKLLGKTLRNIHDSGFAMGDTKFENFLINDSVYVIDAEQAIKTDSKEYRAWDLAVFVLFLSYKFLYEIGEYENILREFLISYSPTKEELLYINNLKNIALLSLFPPLHLNILKKTIGELL
ncbi:serine/threonine protein kinase [Acidianus brierleyi]|uniref:Serine/threonine protein kinase n=1 Tax=Acidianus brierleyi TaxID=41673 RepID=A0A2U9IFX8_9CREN|nr:serine/threonine protein kinase [Acidianus brierleyi]AWR94896.1 serine/threonine protein kinase [Acidianus brierleyi]